MGSLYFLKNFKRDLRKTIDPKDYTIEDKKSETIVKLPGSINGNQFIIKNLEVKFTNFKSYDFEIFCILKGLYSILI